MSQRDGEEPGGGRDVASLEDVLAVLVDCSVHVTPYSCDLDVGLVDEPAVSEGSGFSGATAIHHHAFLALAVMEIVPPGVEVEGWWSRSGRCRSGIVRSHLNYT